MPITLFYFVIQDKSLPVQVFVNKSGETSEKPASPCPSQSSASDSFLFSTPKSTQSPSANASEEENIEDDCVHLEPDSPGRDQAANTTESSLGENDMGEFNMY